MHELSLDDHLPITCTRSGSCCHGHRIAITAWEIAVLARHLDLSQRQTRDRYTTSGATFLRFDAPHSSPGPNVCAFFRDDQGCSVHPARPLACRVYPLARRRQVERTFYTFAGDEHPCLARCPTIKDLPSQRLGDWLLQQHTAPGQSAHDAYGNLAWGMIVTAASIAATDGVDIDAITTECVRRVGLSGDDRIPLMPPPWYDLLTIPELPVALDDAAAFVGAHARRLQQAIANDFALPPTLEEIALLVLTLAIHLSPCIGIDPTAAVAAFTEQAQARRPALAVV